MNDTFIGVSHSNVCVGKHKISAQTGLPEAKECLFFDKMQWLQFQGSWFLFYDEIFSRGFDFNV